MHVDLAPARIDQLEAQRRLAMRRRVADFTERLLYVDHIFEPHNQFGVVVGSCLLTE